MLPGHSLHAGYCTAAAMASVPEWKILNRSRHKTAELIACYVRAREVSKDSGLKGVGFLARRALQWQRSASGPSSYFALRSLGSHDADI
jgi:hypothetical protein